MVESAKMQDVKLTTKKKPWLCAYQSPKVLEIKAWLKPKPEDDLSQKVELQAIRNRTALNIPYPSIPDDYSLQTKITQKTLSI